MQLAVEHLTKYSSRYGYATLTDGKDPREATINFQHVYDYADCTPSFDTDELFDADMYQQTAGGESVFYLTPFSYKTNQRRQDNFKSMSFVALDYDDGYSIATLMQELNQLDLAYTIYTTKSHQVVKNGKPACDRYRVFIQISQNIRTPQETCRFMHAVKNIAPFDQADKACFETARLFAMNPTCQVFVNKGKNCLDVDALAKIGKQSIKKVSANNGKGYVAVDDKQLVFTDNPKKVKRKWFTTLNKYFNKTDWEIENTHQKIFGCVCQMFTRVSDWNVVYNTVKAWPVYKEWIARHPHQAKEIKRLVSKCYHVVYGGEINPKNKTVTLAEKDLEVSPVMDSNARSLREKREMDAEVSLADKMLETLFLGDCKRSIMQVPCGGGKTTGAIALMATYASDSNSFWYVAETRRQCESVRKELEKVFGCDVGYLQGFDPTDCSRTGAFDLEDGTVDYYALDSYREAYDYNHCKGCPDQHSCNFYISRYKPSQILSKSIVIMTHKKFIRNIQQDAVNPDANIIIDEELKRWESFSFNGNDLSTFRYRLSNCGDVKDAALSDAYRQFIDSFDAYIAECDDTGGVELKSLCISDDLRKLMLKVLKSEEYKELNAEAAEKYDVIDKYDKLLEFVSFFSNDSVKYMRHSIQKINKRDVDIYDCSTDVIQFNLPNKTIILNASAKYSHVAWEDFTIFKLDEALDFGNTTCHVILGNPTNRRINKGGTNQKPLVDTIIKQADKIIKQKNISNIFVATNKKESPYSKVTEFMKKHQKKNHNVVDIARGNIQSNNLARDCDIAIVTMANFTTVSDYLLKTAMANEERIDQSRFLDDNKNIRMHKGFDDEYIDEEATRQMVDEIYQTVMRGNIRKDNANHYDVVIVLTPKLLIELMQLFPNAKFESVDKELNVLIQMKDMTDDELNGLSDSKRDKLFGSGANEKTSDRRNRYVSLIRKMKRNKKTKKTQKS